MQLPHLSYLRSFEAAARRLSFTGAAAELHLSQAAVSGHVRALEQYLGGPLFERHARSLSLTTVGTAYLPTVQQALSLIEASTESIVKRQDGRKIVISCPVTLAEGWLAGVIAQFAQADPSVSVTIHARIWRDEPPETADLILGSTHVDALTPAVDVLWKDRIVLCAAPGYRAAGAEICSAQDLTHARLIHVLSHTDLWQLALDELVLAPGAMAVEPTYASSFSTALALAREGLGVAVVPLCYAERHIAEGRLVALFGRAFLTRYVTGITAPEPRASAAVKTAHACILAAARRAPHAAEGSGPLDGD